VRINRFIATYTDFSRRKADSLVESGQVAVNRKTAHNGMDVSSADVIVIEGKRLVPIRKALSTIMLHKPIGYVCSREGQGAPTVYGLIPKGLHHLKVAGRLDKDSSGLVIMTSDGQLLQKLTHPSNNKQKIYRVTLSRPLKKDDIQKLKSGINIGDARLSKLIVKAIDTTTTEANQKTYLYQVTMNEGRNRQIRRSFEALGFKVSSLHRTKIDKYTLGSLKSGNFINT
jgi:23S rRNA pseudouridine2605 synthase